MRPNEERLWFDVEKRYNTTLSSHIFPYPQLWFDVEKRYNTTRITIMQIDISCGLM